MTSRAWAMVLSAGAALMLSSCNGSDGDGMSRDAQIYLATVEAVLATDTPPLEDDDDVPVVYVVPVGETTIDAAVQADVADELKDEADVRFADERSEAVDEDEDDRPVRDGGVLIAVGNVAEDAEPVEVDVEVYRSVNDSSRHVFTVAPVSSEWTVTSSSLVADDAS